MIKNFLIITLLLGNLMHATTVLITGGSGFIGSTTATYLIKNGYNVIVIDKKAPESRFLKKAPLLTSPIEVSSFHAFGSNSDTPGDDEENLLQHILYIQADFADTAILDAIFTYHPIAAVIHFAGFIEVGISVKDPAIFYENNVSKSLVLFKSMIEHQVKNIVFSSSAAVYGMINLPRIAEDTPKQPINPYGRTKYMIEQVLEDFDRAYGLKSICLRYFNAAGAWPEYDIFERHEPETHVIPRLLQAIQTGSTFNIFGTDYHTPDGTCIRDYLHVYDLATAHAKAVEYVLRTNASAIFNLGTGHGHTVHELIMAAQEITGKKATIMHGPRRQGDPDSLVADASHALRELNWTPERSDLRSILRDAWSHTLSKDLV